VVALLQDHVVMIGDRAMAQTPLGTMALDEFEKKAPEAPSLNSL
jgi:hypothetical protein